MERLSKVVASDLATVSLSIEYLPIEKLRPYSGNPRTHSKRQVRQIADSIVRFGWTNPILISDDDEIVAGHGRYAAAKLLHLKSVPTARLSHLSPEDRRAYVIADNRLAELAGWNRDLLAIVLQGLDDHHFDLNLTGFATSETDIILGEAAEKNGPDPDLSEAVEEPDPKAPVVSRRGDLWQLGTHRVLCGDARSAEAYATLHGAEIVDLVVADPPYNRKISGHVSGLGKVKHEEFAFGSGEMNEDEFIAFLHQTLTLTKERSRQGAIHFVFMDAAHGFELLTAARRAGLSLLTTCVWAKTNAGMGSLYRSQVEFVHVFKVGTAPHVNNVELGRFGRSRTTLWSYAGVNTFRKGRMEELTVHPTVKPVALVAEAIKDVSHRHDIVLDPFLGSGTTIIAAEKTGRQGRGIEYEPRFVDSAIRRWQAFTGKQANLVATGESFEIVGEQRGVAESPGTDGNSTLTRSRKRRPSDATSQGEAV